jgi:Lipopolysaccharide-assembly
VRKVIPPSRIRLETGAGARRLPAIAAAALGRLLIIVQMGALAAGCGYHFAAEGSGLPPAAKSIFVQKFGNKSRYTGINDEFMRYLDDEIANHKRLELADSAADADLVLSGEVVFVDQIPIAFNSASEPTTYSQSMSADATLVDTHTHKVIWSTRGISSTAQAPVVNQSVITTSPMFLQQNLRSQDIARLTDIQVAQTQTAASKDQMMQTLATNLYASMSEGF